jgi:uncharacterized protein (DUF433 family)
MERRMFGQYIVADPKICHGKLTFVGTRIMVFQILEMIAEGMDWDSISDAWDGKVSKDAILEAVNLATHMLADSALIEQLPDYRQESALA